VVVVSHEMPTHLRTHQGERQSAPPTMKCEPRERERDRRTTGRAARGQGGGEWWTPPRSGSFGQGEKEREMTLPPLSSLRITLPPLCDVICRQVGTTSDERQLKHPRTGTEPSIDLPRWLLPTQVTSDHGGKDELLASDSGTMVLTPSFRI
jgi:hypothetical protein